MAKRQNNTKLKPEMTDEGQENMLASLAEVEAERRIREGTASNALILHYINEGSELTKLKKEKLRKENELLEAKKKAIDVTIEDHDQLNQVLSAFKLYSGDTDEDLQ